MVDLTLQYWRTVTLVRLGRLDEARRGVQALLALKPTLKLGEAREIFDYLPDPQSYVDALRQAGLPE